MLQMMIRPPEHPERQVQRLCQPQRMRATREIPIMTAVLTHPSPFSAVSPSDLEPAALRRQFAQFPSGVAVLAAEARGVKEGIVSTSFSVGVSWEPPLVSFAVQYSSRTWPRLRRASRIGISVLAAGQEAVCSQVASRTGDRFAGLDLRQTEAGALLLEGAALWLETSIHAEVPAGDHYVVLLRVHEIHDHSGEHEPLVYHRSGFRNLHTAEDPR